MGQRTNLLLQVERFGKPSEEGVCSLFRGEERSANGHGRSGARLNRVYHLQWGYRKYLPMAFLRLLSSRYFKPQKTDIFEFFTRGLDLDSLDMIEQDWNKYDFNQLDECQDALSHCDNNNGAMVVVITEDARDYYHPKYKLGFLLGPEHLEGESPFSRWVTTEKYMRHQPGYKGEYDDIFAHAFDALTILSGTQHVVQLKDEK